MKNMPKWITIFCLALTGCATSNIDNPPKYDIADLGLKVAVLADSQITTDLMNEDYGFRSKFADKLFAEVAIRTPAQEHLAKTNLGHTLDDIAKQKPDLILYLGDGVNSGCEREVEDLFDALNGSLDRSSDAIPIFFILGNHDYLATGNQTESKIRQKTCGDGNPYLNKAEIAERASKFNRSSFALAQENNEISFISYKDNLSSGSVGNRPYTECENDNPDIQHYTGCFYASIIEYKAGNITGQILLTDSSDYREVKAKPQHRSFALYGLRGSMSWGEEGQVDWFVEETQKMEEPTVRVVASHYPIKNLAWTGLVAGRHGKLLLPGYRKNLWLSAHSHSQKLNKKAKYYKMKFQGDPDKYVIEYNTGSTTDYIPRFDIIETNQGNVERRSHPIFPGITEKTVRRNEVKRCENKIESINNTGSFISPETTKNTQDPYFLLGLKKHYQRKNYKAEIARENIKKFFFESDFAPDVRKDFEKCIMLISSKNERK